MDRKVALERTGMGMLVDALHIGSPVVARFQRKTQGFQQKKYVDPTSSTLGT